MNVSHETRRVLGNRVGDHLKDLDCWDYLLDAGPKTPMKEGIDKVDWREMRNISATCDIRMSEGIKTDGEKASR